jgi:hypothetical protein
MKEVMSRRSYSLDRVLGLVINASMALSIVFIIGYIVVRIK